MTDTTPAQVAATTIEKLFESKGLAVAARIFMILGGALASLIVLIAGAMWSDISTMKAQLVAMELQLTPQIAEMKAEISEIKNEASMNRSDLDHLRDHLINNPPGPTVVVNPTRTKHP